jgi:hypothetical protein
MPIIIDLTKPHHVVLLYVLMHAWKNGQIR